MRPSRIFSIPFLILLCFACSSDRNDETASQSQGRTQLWRLAVDPSSELIAISRTSGADAMRREVVILDLSEGTKSVSTLPLPYDYVTDFTWTRYSANSALLLIAYENVSDDSESALQPLLLRGIFKDRNLHRLERLSPLGWPEDPELRISAIASSQDYPHMVAALKKHVSGSDGTLMISHDGGMKWDSFDAPASSHLIWIAQSTVAILTDEGQLFEVELTDGEAEWSLISEEGPVSFCSQGEALVYAVDDFIHLPGGTQRMDPSRGLPIETIVCGSDSVFTVRGWSIAKREMDGDLVWNCRLIEPVLVLEYVERGGMLIGFSSCRTSVVVLDVDNNPCQVLYKIEL